MTASGRSVATTPSWSAFARAYSFRYRPAATGASPSRAPRWRRGDRRPRRNDDDQPRLRVDRVEEARRPGDGDRPERRRRTPWGDVGCDVDDRVARTQLGWGRLVSGEVPGDVATANAVRAGPTAGREHVVAGSRKRVGECAPTKPEATGDAERASASDRHRRIVRRWPAEPRRREIARARRSGLSERPARGSSDSRSRCPAEPGDRGANGGPPRGNTKPSPRRFGVLAAVWHCEQHEGLVAIGRRHADHHGGREPGRHRECRLIESG